MKSDYISKHIQAVDEFIELGYIVSTLMKQLTKSAIDVEYIVGLIKAD